MKFQASTIISSMLLIAVSATPVGVESRNKKSDKPAGCSAPAVSSNRTVKGTIDNSGAAKPSNSTKAGLASGNGTTAATNSSSTLPDGRIKQNALATDFNVLASVFKSAVVKGDGLLFSDIIQFPNTTQSLFDVATNTKSFEITLSDKSIFIPQGGTPDTTSRRADLLPSIRSTLNNVSTTGIKTMHFSIQQDASKPLNLTHDYQIAFLETADFTTHQFDVRMGKVVDAAAGSPGADGTNIVVNGNSKTAGGAPTIFSTPLTTGFQNFAVKMDFDQHTIQVFHSTDNNPLKQVTEPVSNDMTGNGEYHFALLKNAVAGFQPSGINEAMIFGGIFMEDSAVGTVTLQ